MIQGMPMRRGLVRKDRPNKRIDVTTAGLEQLNNVAVAWLFSSAFSLRAVIPPEHEGAQDAELVVDAHLCRKFEGSHNRP